MRDVVLKSIFAVLNLNTELRTLKKPVMNVAVLLVADGGKRRSGGRGG